MLENSCSCWQLLLENTFISDWAKAFDDSSQGGKKYHDSLDGAVTLRALSHHIAPKNLLSLHSGDWQLFILLWLCNKTLSTNIYDWASSVCVRVSVCF